MADDEDLRSLVERGADLTSRYLRAGPGTPAGKPRLDEAITVLEEAYGRIEHGEALRGQVAGQLGWLYGVRHLAHGGGPRDRTTAMHLLDESLEFPHQAPVMAGGSKIILGQLLLAGATAAMGSPDAMMAMMTGGGGGRPTDTADADRAIALFREVADGPRISAELTSTARTLVTVGEALRGMLGGAGGLDLNKLGQALTAMQTMQQQMRGGGVGMVPPPMPDLSAFAAATAPPPVTTAGPASSAAAPTDSGRSAANAGARDATAGPSTANAGPSARAAGPSAADDGPFARAAGMPGAVFDPGRVAVADGPMPDAGPLPRRRPPAPPAVSAAELRDRLSAEPLTLLEARDSATVDDHVALAAAVTEAPGAGPGDHLALAAALIARHRADDGGAAWPGVPDDLHAAARAFDRAAPDLPDMTPEEVRAAVRIAAELPHPIRLEKVFAEVTAAMRDAGIGALAYPSLALDSATGRLEPVPDGTLWSGRVAATVPIDGDATVSYVRNATDLLTLLRRERPPIAAAAVFVANPRRDRESATVDALRLRRAFYPRSAGLGQTIEQNDGDGTPEQVAAHLNASLLHLGCGITADGALELAGPALLTPAAIAAAPAVPPPGGVAVLPPDPAAGPALAGVLLDRGFRAVIGFTGPVPDRVASLVYWMLHAALVDDGLPPAEAVAAVRAWLRDPQRKPPELLAAEYHGVAAAADLADPAVSRTLICHGC